MKNKNIKLIRKIALIVVVLIINIIGLYKVVDFYSNQRFLFSDYNSRSAYIKGLSSSPLHLTPRFFTVQERYRDLFEDYLNERLDFESFDEELMHLGIPNSKMDKSFNNKSQFSALNESDVYYMKHSNLGSNYLFLRNTISIERLDFNDIKLIMSSGNKKIKDAVINKSYLNVIKYFNTNEKILISYLYPHRPENAHISNTDIVLYVWCPYEINGNQIDEMLVDGVQSICKKYEDIYSKQLGTRVRIININWFFKLYSK